MPRAEISGVDGWVAVHADDNGRPGEVLEHAPLREGENADVAVRLDGPASSGRLYAWSTPTAPTMIGTPSQTATRRSRPTARPCPTEKRAAWKNPAPCAKLFAPCACSSGDRARVS